MLSPKKTKFRKQFKGKIHGAAKLPIRTRIVTRLDAGILEHAA